MSRIREVAPLFLVADIVRAAAYFTDVCGFTVKQFWGRPPNFCIPERDGIRIMLSQVDAGAPIHPNADSDGRYDAYFWVDDADKLFAEFSARGADIVCKPSDEPYGMREFRIRDLDGHLLAFGRPLADGAKD